MLKSIPDQCLLSLHKIGYESFSVSKLFGFQYNSTGNFEKRMVHVRAAFHQWGFRETEDMEADWLVMN